MRRVVKWGVWLGVGGVLLTGLVFLGLEVAVLVVSSSLPEVIDSDQFDREIWQVSRVMTRNGEVLAEIFKERRTVVDTSTLPAHVIDAVVSAEDASFFRHEGIDWLAMARALVIDLVRGRFVQGGSTITQQLARNLYLNQEKTLLRKVKEVLLARKIEKSLTKDSILHQYLNLVYWGHGNYGIQEASKFYFDKDARYLSLPEAAVLAGMIQGPENISPLKSEEKALEKMRYVLRQMEKLGYSQLEGAGSNLPPVHGIRRVLDRLSPYGVDMAVAEFKAAFPKRSLDRGGYRLYTTLDETLQEAVNKGVESLRASLHVSPIIRQQAPESLCDCLQDGRILPGCPVWAKVLKWDSGRNAAILDISGRLGLLPATTLSTVAGRDGKTPKLKKGDWLKVLPASEIELVSPWITEETTVVQLVSPQVAVVVLHAPSGEVRALFGGLDHSIYPYNRALSARRQVGSTIKPFIYLAAMEKLGWDDETLVDATPLELTGKSGRPWRIRDMERHPDYIPVKTALALSSNTAAVRTLRELGVTRFLATWQEWGLPALDTADLSLALGSCSMTPLEMARAWAMLATGRCAPPPTVLAKVSDNKGRELPLPSSTCAGRVSTRGVLALKNALALVIEEGTGKEAAIEGVTVYGKTGTTEGGRDAWFAGLLGDLVLVVWVGSDDSSPIEGNSGPTTAARIWKAIALQIVKEAHQ